MIRKKYSPTSSKIIQLERKLKEMKCQKAENIIRVKTLHHTSIFRKGRLQRFHNALLSKKFAILNKNLVNDYKLSRLIAHNETILKIAAII